MRLSFLCVKNQILLFSAAAAFILISAGCGAVSTAEKTTFQMDTVVTQKWHGKNAEKTCKEIEEAIADLEAQVSLYKEDSEISMINAGAGKEYVQVSDNIYDMLSSAWTLCEESGGIFDITIAPLSLLWNITGEDPHVPSREEIDAALQKVDYKKLLFDDKNSSVMLADEGMKLDLGGTAKGMAVEQMMEIARENEVQGFLSIGGNVGVVGKNPDGSEIIVGLRDPLGDANDYFATLEMDGYTMATSNATERYFEQDGIVYHHIIDPFTGYPGDSDLLSVTVISEDGLLADTLSTTIFLEGSTCLEEYFAREDCMVIAVTKDCKVYASDKVWQILTPYNTTDYEFNIK